MLKPIIAANWKMNHGPTDARAFARQFLAHYRRDTDRTVVFFPPSITLAALAEALEDRHEFMLGVQNIYHEATGAYTGEISAGMARDAGARLVLVGHSERRKLFGETDEQTGIKCQLVVKAGLIPMLCVGETLEEREAGLTEQVVLRQLAAGIEKLETPQIGTMLVAYEPVWAIGTGRTATPQDASVVHAAIRRALRERIGERAAVLPILYGGSVNRGNAKLLLAAPDVDGLLVGGASLDAGNWAAICQD
jgi:triosephosphate isomerase